ncbi:MAG: MlaE family lipid ABC transporter permease subunit [Candidatus Cloacimonetes bacterium]|jgi:phospholipid/cholesterol/gamma-HCH transport system permease protein|nr:MlaE family lipid ABC transporter permease subunit [Candidatus Cloacimonadota bacterium]MDY0336290.1 MlaE family lipid ABC transporter permease subunit [Candidatus Cloacimonadaceae bacterium]MCK9335408.1 MlaE family lipid ABC transporter permease subunit [Candidatus Cloacimonadota bacterium]MDD2542838.1 MlaE family lipid ABC transporter permease subunit [Candidatus Cloacimonadota bacterium]MDD2683869.1 MlaE family lipid ABC transporter permease subunit [Candidatus Cloacimonadota bacterium]
MKVSNATLYLEGEFSKHKVYELERELNSFLKTEHINTVDLSGISMIDSAGVALLDEIHTRLQPKARILLFRAASSEVQAVIDTFTTLKLEVQARDREMGFFEKLGDSALYGWSQLVETFTLASEVFYYSVIGLFDRRKQRKGSFVQQALLLGFDALPIVALLSFIIGFIIALQSGVLLRDFGANVFIADLMAVSIVRELSPLITAIIVAGRSGSAIASEIATMQVTEELDALRMMALNPIRYVVVPKFHAITVVMPILIVLSILVSMIGGAIIALGYLGLSVEVFYARSVEILTIKDIVISFGKSIWFAWVIVVIGSHFGFQVKGGAEGVGKSTTSAVVASIFAVIIFDAIFSLLYL